MNQTDKVNWKDWSIPDKKSVGKRTGEDIKIWMTSVDKTQTAREK